jgi:hypothetical protein
MNERTALAARRQQSTTHETSDANTTIATAAMKNAPDSARQTADWRQRAPGANVRLLEPNGGRSSNDDSST